MTTKVTIEAEIHSQEKLVQVQVLESGVVQETIYLKPGQKTEQYVYGARTLGIVEVEEASAGGIRLDGTPAGNAVAVDTVNTNQ